MKRFIAIAIVAALGIGALGAHTVRTHAQNAATAAVVAAATTCQSSPISQLANTGIQGNAILCTDGAGVHADMATTGLTPGNAYTVWFVYFDHPSLCQSTPCGPPDGLGDNPTGAFGRMDSVVADQTGSASFSGSFRGLRLSSKSEVWLLIFGHGAASTTDNRMLARQLLTPQKTVLGTPGLGTVADGDLGSGVAQAYIDLP